MRIDDLAFYFFRVPCVLTRAHAADIHHGWGVSWGYTCKTLSHQQSHPLSHCLMYGRQHFVLHIAAAAHHKDVQLVEFVNIGGINWLSISEVSITKQFG